MAVLLLILKIIGIILLILLGLILLILAVVLFVPVSGERQHRGEDDRPDCCDMAFACGKLEGSVRRGRVFFTAVDLWDHPERKKAGRWRTRGG